MFFCWLLQCFGHIQYKNQVAMLEVIIFKKLEKTEQATRFKEGPASKGLKCYAFVQKDVYIQALQQHACYEYH